MHDLVILGGGPSGLTAAMYAVQKRLDVILATRDLGGKTNYNLQLPFVERHMVITGDEIVDRFTREIEYLDFILRLDNVEGVEKVQDGFRVALSGGEQLLARAIIVATGARGQLLDVPGERKFMMRGLCYSAVSYAQLFVDRTVAVIGCGDLAYRGAAELARVAKKVNLISENCSDITSSPIGNKLLSEPHVEFFNGYTIAEVKGDKYARSVVIDSGGEQQELNVDGIFVELGLIPRSDIVAHLVDLNASGHIKIDARNTTSQPGIFAAGDVTDGFTEQVLIGIGEGAKAALSAYEFLLRQEAERVNR